MRCMFQEEAATKVSAEVVSQANGIKEQDTEHAGLFHNFGNAWMLLSHVRQSPKLQHQK